MSKSIDERFWSKVNKDGPIQPHMDTACWQWTAGKHGDGYGQIRVDGKLAKAHRAGWLLQTGEEPTYLRHRCDNPACVRVSHLINGKDYREQHKLNVQEAYARGLTNQKRGEDSGMSKLTEDLVKLIRKRAAEGVSQRILGKDYGVTHGTIGYLVRRQTWAHVS